MLSNMHYQIDLTFMIALLGLLLGRNYYYCLDSVLPLIMKMSLVEQIDLWQRHLDELSPPAKNTLNINVYEIWND